MANFKEELEQKGYLTYTNKGISMMPLLRQDTDVFVIRRREDGVYRKNDAVLFLRDSGAYVLHRITRVRRDGRFFIIGDNCTSGEIVRPDQILGVMTEVHRDGKVICSDSREYRRYVCFLPLRRFFFIHWRFAKRVVRKIIRMIKK